MNAARPSIPAPPARRDVGRGRRVAASAALLALALVAGGGRAPAGEIRAVIVGVDDYLHNDARNPRGDLAGCALDARRFERLLRERFGARPENVRLLEDAAATNRAVQEALDANLARACRPEDVAVFFFSGHGTRFPDDDPPGTDEADGMDEAICLHDQDDGDRSTWLTDDMIRRHLMAIPARHVLVVFDACHSGDGTRGVRGSASPFGWTKRGVRPEERETGGMREKGARDGELFISACPASDTVRVARDEDGRAGGALTIALCKLAGGPTAELPLERFEGELGREVAAIAGPDGGGEAQVPVVEAARKDYSLRAFVSAAVFGPGDGVAPPQPPPGVLAWGSSQGSIRVSIATERPTYRWTEDLTARVTVDRDAFVRVYHVDASGEPVQIFPNAEHREHRARAGQELALPPPGASYALRVTGPGQGLELLVAVASGREFGDAEIGRFASGLFNALPGETLGAIAHRGISVEERPGAPGAPAPGAGTTAEGSGRAIALFRVLPR